MTPTIGALCCLYDDLTWLEPSIASVYAECDRIYFVINDKPWSGPPRNLEPTLAAVAGLDDPDGKIRVIRGDWPIEHVQRNAGLDAMAADGMTYCFVHDCDEIFDPADLRAMKATVFASPEIDRWDMRWFTYWKSARFRIDPPEAYEPMAFVRIGAGRFSWIRRVDTPSRRLIDPEIGMCHHMSYARSNAAVHRKISSFSHAHEIVPGWFNNVWLAWDLDPTMTNLHPVHPAAYARAIEQPLSELPPVLRDRFLRKGNQSLTQ
jgi:hypothetical protein